MATALSGFVPVETKENEELFMVCILKIIF